MNISSNLGFATKTPAAKLTKSSPTPAKSTSNVGCSLKIRNRAGKPVNNHSVSTLALRRCCMSALGVTKEEARARGLTVLVCAVSQEIAEALGSLSSDSSEEEVLTTRVVRRRVIIQVGGAPGLCYNPV